MKFQICTCKKHLFIHGYFFDENGSFFRGNGLDHLSGDVFSQTDARKFIQESLDSKKIKLGEACELVRAQALFSLPEECPSNLALYQKNEKSRVGKLVTPEGKRLLDTLVEPRFSLKRLFVRLKRQW